MISPGLICGLVFTWEEHVHQLTVGGPSPELLHLPYLGLEVGVDPGQHLVPGEILIGDGGVEHIDGHPQTDCQLAGWSSVGVTLTSYRLTFSAPLCRLARAVSENNAGISLILISLRC